MINVIANVYVKQGKSEEFLEIFKALVPTVLAEDGCIAYAPTQDVDSGIGAQFMTPNSFAIVEKWTTVEALQAHNQQPHMNVYRANVKDLVEKVTLQVTQDV